MITIDREIFYNTSYDLRSICPPEEMLLFDIETTGLRKESTQLYLIGCAWWENGHWYTRQWLTENLSDEYYVLEDFLKFASGFRTLLHFNGDRFDIPYLQYKCDYYRTQTDLSGFHSFDLYQRAKTARAFLGGIRMSQKALEELLGVVREDRLNGGLLIPVYYEYEKTGAKNEEDLLLLHNFDDLQGMLKILPMAAFGDLFDGDFVYTGVEERNGYAVFSYQLQHPVPAAAAACLHHRKNGKLCLCPAHAEPLVRVSAEKDLLQICFCIIENEGYFPLKPVSDYYYLPDEDMVIHKDVAQFLDRSKRIKATAKNCAVRRKGRFIAQIRPGEISEFFLWDDRKCAFCDWDSLLLQIRENPEWASSFLKKQACDCLDLIAVQ